MNKVLRPGNVWLVCLLVCVLSMGCALAEGASAAEAAITGFVLVGDLPKDAEMAEDYSDAEGNYRQVLIRRDGAITIVTLRQKVDDKYPMEMPIEEFLQKYLELEQMPAMETVEVEPVAAYPTERVRFQVGENEDTSIEDVVLIRTNEYYFAFIVHTSADTYYGFSDGYEEGDAAQIVDIWAESLDLFDPGEAMGGE